MGHVSGEPIHCVSKLSSANTEPWRPKERATHSADSMSDLKVRKIVNKHSDRQQLGCQRIRGNLSPHQRTQLEDLVGRWERRVGVRRRASDGSSPWVYSPKYQTPSCSMPPLP